MHTPPNYVRAFRRAFFIVLLIGLPLISPLTAKLPRPEFSKLRHLLYSIPLEVYGGIGAAAALVLGVSSSWRRVRFKRVEKRSSADPLWEMPIDHCVRPEHGGNGLASKPIVIPGDGKINIHTRGMECVVIDGIQVVRHTYRQPFWKQMENSSKARRVLLTPQPCTIPAVKTLSNDQLETSISAAVTYRVIDPCAVLVQAPLQEFTNLVQGVMIEHIHTHGQAELLSDRGILRAELETRLRESKTLTGFQIIEVSILSVDGDRRLIEIGTQTRLEEKRADLIHQQGMNKIQTADYDLKIDQLRLQLTEWAKNQDHNRLLEQEILRLNAENVQAVIGAVTALAAQGQNPDSAIGALQTLLTQQSLALPASTRIPQLAIGETKGEQTE